MFLRLAPVLEALTCRAGVTLASLLAPFRGGWANGLAALKQRLQAPLDLDAILETMHCAYHCGERPGVAGAVEEAGRFPTLTQSAPAAFFPLWFGRYGLPRLAAMAQRWLEAHGQFSLERFGRLRGARQRAPLDWPALLGTGATRGGLCLDELKRLGEAIAIVHPAEARRAGLIPYLRNHGAVVLAAMGTD